MKKLFIIAGVLLAAVITNGQSLQKGNLVGVHVLTFNLNAGVTEEQYIDFYKKNILPIYEKYAPGLKVYYTKGVRGENAGKIGMIVVFPDQKERDKFWNPDGSATELNLKSQKEMQPALDELAKMGTDTFVYTDWLIQ